MGEGAADLEVPSRDISWTRRNEDGERVEVYVDHVGDQWIFYSRERRHDEWQVMENPPQEDWQELLDAVERRIGRGLIKPIEAERLRKIIQLRFP